MTDWFNGNADAKRLYEEMCLVAHVWDDVVDKDKDVPEWRANAAFEAALISIPCNPFYRQHEALLRPMMVAGCWGYRTANRMERSGDAHQIEIAHGLRYAIAHVGAAIVNLTNTRERADELLPDFWKSMIPERIDAYIKEHTNADSHEV